MQVAGKVAQTVTVRIDEGRLDRGDAGARDVAIRVAQRHDPVLGTGRSRRVLRLGIRHGGPDRLETPALKLMRSAKETRTGALSGKTALRRCLRGSGDRMGIASGWSGNGKEKGNQPAKPGWCGREDSNLHWSPN